MKISNIKIKNFGPIKEANIDISPLTIFIGPNSCGKSFAAKLIHCLSLTPDEDILEIGLKHVADSFKNLNGNNKIQVMELVDEINNYLKTNPTINSEPLKIPIEKIDNLVYEGIIVYLSEIISEMITDQFGEELDDLISFNKDFFKINIRNNELFKKTNEKLIVNVGTISIISDKEPKDGEEILMHVHTDDENFIFNIESLLLNKTSLDDFTIFLLFYQKIGLSIFKSILLENSFYIPAERSELIIDKKLLTRKIQNKSDVSKNQSEVLANILNIDSSKKSIFYNLACELEKEFSNISIGIDDSNIFNSISFKNTQTNKIMSSKLLSTSLHEISIFILYLKYVLKEGDLLIIEEPEAHIHPKLQRILAKYFVRAINQGLKIILTTHSDYIIEQFNNFIRLGTVNEEIIGYLNFTDQDILNYEDINIYHFKKDADYNFITYPLEINSTGFNEENFSEVIESLYDESNIIIENKLR